MRRPQPGRNPVIRSPPFFALSGAAMKMLLFLAAPERY